MEKEKVNLRDITYEGEQKEKQKIMTSQDYTMLRQDVNETKNLLKEIRNQLANLLIIDYNQNIQPRNPDL